jgi:hypothetical protein
MTGYTRRYGRLLPVLAQRQCHNTGGPPAADGGGVSAFSQQRIASADALEPTASEELLALP